MQVEEKKGTISKSKPEVETLEYDEDDSEFACYKESDSKLVHLDIYKEVTEVGPAQALLPNKMELQDKDNKGETLGGTITLVYAGLTKHLDNRTDWVVNHIFQSNV